MLRLGKALKNLGIFFLSGAIPIIPIYAYTKYKANSNLKDYLASINSDTIKDASRMSNESFGISWGFQADDTIMNRIDSGDLLFFKFECSECLSSESMVQCHLSTVFHLEHEMDGMGIGYRTKQGLFVHYNEFGTTKTKRYSQFVSLPYLREVALQKSDVNDLQTHQKLSKIVDCEQEKKEGVLRFANRLLKNLGKKKFVTSINQLKTSSQIINIRTDVNRKLRSL